MESANGGMCGYTIDFKDCTDFPYSKHDRPYKCLVKGCENLKGYKYSSGLLRHEREAHRIHGGTKKPLFCPFTDCMRSSGISFTRNEHLAGHLDRVHGRTSTLVDVHSLLTRYNTMESTPTVESPKASGLSCVSNMEQYESEEPSLKRKRVTGLVHCDCANEDLRIENKRLRGKGEEADSRLRQLEQAVDAGSVLILFLMICVYETRS
jgi:hypothetical protein